MERKSFNLADIQTSAKAKDEFAKIVDVEIFGNPVEKDPFAWINDCIKEILSFKDRNIQYLKDALKYDSPKVVDLTYYINAACETGKKKYITIYFSQEGNFKVKKYFVSYISGVYFFNFPTILYPQPLNLPNPELCQLYKAMEMQTNHVMLDEFGGVYYKPLVPTVFYDYGTMSYIPDFNKHCNLLLEEDTCTRLM